MDLSRYSVAHFDRGATRAQEALWMAARLLFFLNPVPWPSELRVVLLRAFGATVGEKVTIRSGVNVTFPWRLRIGSHVWLGEGSTFLSLAEISIGDHVCVSQQAYLCTGSHDFRAETFDLITRPIHVGSQVWLAARCFIGPGVRIGERSVIAAGATVMRDVPAGSRVSAAPVIVGKIAP